MKKALKMVLLASLAVFNLSCELDYQTAAELQNYFSELHENEGFNGTVLIAEKGKILYTGGFGFRNIEDASENNPDTIFNIASLSKQFTSMCIMMLSEKGLLSVDDTIGMYVPELIHGNEITIKQCLTHTSGLTEFLANEELWNHTDEQHTPAALLGYFADADLDFTPGTDWAYSNTNYITLGIIIERVSGTDYSTFLQQNIFSKLKMHRSFYDAEDDDIYCNRSTGYDSIDPAAEAMYFHPSLAYAAGAVHSTAVDMFKWIQALKSQKLVSRDTLNEIFTPGIGNYGYGWFIDQLQVNNVTYNQTWHWGSFFGYGSYVTRLVDEDVTIIILKNTTVEAPEEFGSIIRNVVSIVLQDMD
ncbi:MAG: beta-lactamase family protein [Spirochaetes bacterium]|nr:beta-lactamase family protein [Spirochaetota bacterium]